MGRRIEARFPEAGIEFVNPPLLARDQALFDWHSFEDCKRECGSAICVPGCLQVRTVMHAPSEMMPVNMPSHVNIDGRSDIDPAAGIVTYGVYALDFHTN